ncbi:DUF6562 domain-containing protein [Bacteroides fluxus]|uniref:DUF6562 domain-containing protein n=1 Tax=Bacteroides fluxus TaxID=626930 RepID=UPI0023536402|nr:DUF6562 domain-containing protein [Bacteroides fluxus]
MKKNFLYSVMALFVILLASCSQEEIISENSENGKITVSVGVPGSATTRARMPEVESMTRRCIMQVVDENGTAIEGEEMRQTTEVTGDKVNFSFTEPEGEYSVVFWADYVTSIAKDNCYNTAALPNVTLAHNKNTMFTAAGDAFCGKMAKGGSTSIVLKRPFNKIVVGSTNKEAFGECKEIQIAEFSVPDGYNIMSKTCSAAKNIKRERIAMNDATAGEWTSFFVFAPSNQTDTKLELPIMLYKEGDATDAPAIKFTASTSAPTDENMIGSMDIPNIPADKVDVEISFDDKFTNDGSTEPEEPVVPGEMKVGSYINAAGEVVTDAANAVAVIFAMADGKADNSTYPDTKKAKAYAISLDKVTSRLVIGDLSSLTLEVTADDETTYSGFAFDTALKGKCGNLTTEQSKLLNAYYSATLPTLTGANLSTWYIPSKTQLNDALSLDNATLKANLKAAYSSNYYCLSSSVAEYTPKEGNAYNSVCGVLYEKNDEVVSKTEACGATTSALIFPCLTIFGE